MRMLTRLFVVGCIATLSVASLSIGQLEEKEHLSGQGLCDPNVKQYTGYFTLTTGKLPKHYFYWFFESRNAPATDPLVMWMTGGPGCSSEVALFGENGPCSINSDGSNTTLNPYSWNTRANLLYIDQPAGTGFSYGAGMDHNEAGVAVDMYDFLQQFMKAHPEYQALDFYAFGESYAGHYVPAVTHQVWKNNKDLPTGAVKIKLKGTSVGNGLTDPEIQYKYYADMGISTNGHSAVFNKTAYNLMKAATPACIKAIQACQSVTASCVVAIDVCNLALLIPYTLTGMNPYDMRIKCQKPPLCYDFSNVATYLAREDVISTLGVSGHKWSDCNHAVALAFELSGDWMKNYQDMIPDQLNDGIRVLLYAGDQDYICNWLGNQAWAMALDWPHAQEFNSTQPSNFTSNDITVGNLRSSNGFSFLQVYNAGHMVPRDQPAAALEMMNAFISGKI